MNNSPKDQQWNNNSNRTMKWDKIKFSPIRTNLCVCALLRSSDVSCCYEGWTVVENKVVGGDHISCETL